MTAEGQDNPAKQKSAETFQDAGEWAYFFHRSNRIHLVDLGSKTLYLDADVGALFNNLVTVIGPLRRCSIRIELDVGWDHLPSVSRLLDINVGIYTFRPTNACKDPQSTKKPARITDVTTPSIYTQLA